MYKFEDLKLYAAVSDIKCKNASHSMSSMQMFNYETCTYIHFR